ncbi:MAG: eukaryotic-like serine/threonine-protein kinase, partial [Myxococcales bacterium]|nr:eukaryotic-like serine/threonine-protein kinase [Myxococcales bacterium]
PENLLRMEDGRVVLSDFGLATNPNQVPTVTVLVGTPSYMAPEIVMGDPAGFRSDVWALGVTMHEIVFGKRPEWDVVDNERIFRSPVDKDGPALHRQFAELCGLCASERPEKRPANAGEVLRSLTTTEQSGGKGSAFSSLKTVRRRRAGWAIAAFLSIASIVALLGTRTLWSTAAAGTSENRSRVISSPSGIAENWTATSDQLATLNGKVHCVSFLEQSRKIRVVWGKPRVAEDIDIATGQRRESDLRTDTYASGCPQLSPTGNELLYEKFDANGRRQIFLSPTGDGSQARSLTTGVEPVWLRNGNEFAYSVDDGHAAIFSMPLMTSTIVTDGVSGARSVIGKAVNPGGNVLALRYMDSSFNKTIVFHALPSLQVLKTLTLSKSSKEISFGRNGMDLLMSYEEGGNVILVDLPPLVTSPIRMGLIPGAQLREAMTVEGRIAFLAQRVRSDVWSTHDGRPTIQLTFDGKSYNPDVSARGDLLSETLQPGGDLFIGFRRSGHKEYETLTTGPADLTPSFLADQDNWLYVKADRREIIQCSLSTRACRVLYSADVLPIFPIGSPDGNRVAFLSAVSRSRLFILSQDGAAKDLGPARMDCAPRWSSDDSIWVLQGSDDRAEWVELLAGTGRATGRRTAAGESNSADYGCPYSRFPAAANKNEVAAVSAEASELRLH